MSFEFLNSSGLLTALANSGWPDCIDCSFQRGNMSFASLKSSVDYSLHWLSVVGLTVLIAVFREEIL